jgi:hypothetical protein
VDTSKTALLFLGTNETSVKKSLNANNDEPTDLNLFFKKFTGISSLFDRIVPIYFKPRSHK